MWSGSIETGSMPAASRASVKAWPLWPLAAALSDADRASAERKGCQVTQAVSNASATTPVTAAMAPGRWSTGARDPARPTGLANGPRPASQPAPTRGGMAWEGGWVAYSTPPAPQTPAADQQATPFLQMPGRLYPGVRSRPGWPQSVVGARFGSRQSLSHSPVALGEALSDPPIPASG